MHAHGDGGVLMSEHETVMWTDKSVRLSPASPQKNKYLQYDKSLPLQPSKPCDAKDISPEQEGRGGLEIKAPHAMLKM